MGQTFPLLSIFGAVGSASVTATAFTLEICSMGEAGASASDAEFLSGIEQAVRAVSARNRAEERRGIRCSIQLNYRIGSQAQIAQPYKCLICTRRMPED